MIRNELCSIAKLNPSTFNVHRKNGDLPFQIETLEAKDGTGRTWGRFSLYHAALLIAARQLTTQGVSWSEACRILRQKPVEVGAVGPGTSFRERSEICVARVDFVNSLTNAAPDFPLPGVFRGPLGDIVAAAAASVDGYNKKWAGQAAPVVIASIVVVDLSHAYNLAALIAVDLGIDASGVEKPEASKPDQLGGE